MQMWSMMSSAAVNEVVDAIFDVNAAAVDIVYVSAAVKCCSCCCC